MFGGDNPNVMFGGNSPYPAEAIAAPVAPQQVRDPIGSQFSIGTPQSGAQTPVDATYAQQPTEFRSPNGRTTTEVATDREPWFTSLPEFSGTTLSAAPIGVEPVEDSPTDPPEPSSYVAHFEICTPPIQQTGVSKHECHHCKRRFRSGESVYSLYDRQHFHQECLNKILVCRTYMSIEEDTTTCDSEELSEDSSDVQEFPGYSCGESATHVRDYAAFPIQTRLQDGRPSIIIDPGSVGNLCGDRWAKEVALMAKANGRHPTHHLRERALQVSGVGNGSQKCHYDCDLPVAIRPVGQGKLQNGVLKVPAVADSDLPGLMGLTALKKNKAILDFNTLMLYFCSDTQYNLERLLPKRTDCYQLETAPSGHLVLPCCEYKFGGDSQDYSLTLMAESAQPLNTAEQVKVE